MTALHARSRSNSRRGLIPDNESPGATFSIFGATPMADVLTSSDAMSATDVLSMADVLSMVDRPSMPDVLSMTQSMPMPSSTSDGGVLS